MQHNDFSFEPLARETLMLVVRSVHPLASRARITLRELIDWPWVAAAYQQSRRACCSRKNSRVRELATPVNLTECASIFATLQLLENYDAVAMLPESVVRDHLRGKLLVALPLEIGKSLAGFGILTRKEEPLRRAGAALHRTVARFLAAPPRRWRHHVHAGREGFPHRLAEIGIARHCRLTNSPPSTSNAAPVT